MKKNIFLPILLLFCTAMLTACSADEQYINNPKNAKTSPLAIDSRFLQYATAYTKIGMSRSLYIYESRDTTAELCRLLKLGAKREVTEPQSEYGSLFEIYDYYMEEYIIGLYENPPEYVPDSGQNAVNADSYFLVYTMQEGEPEFEADSRHLLYNQQTNKWYTFNEEQYHAMQKLLGYQPVAHSNAQMTANEEIEVTPELRKEYFALARLNSWSFMPDFSSFAELPTDPLAYWFMIIYDGANGWNEQGDLLVDSPWLKPGTVEIDSRFEPIGISGSYDEYVAISAAEFDEWLRQHFGDVQIEHQVSDPIATHHNKNYHCDGQVYYNTNIEGVWPDYWGLTALSSREHDGRTIYTADIDLYRFNEMLFFYYDNDISLEENLSWFANCVNNSPAENLAVYKTYGEQIMHNKISMDKAIEQMIIDGDTAEFLVISSLTVQFYINEETQQPFYLSAKRQNYY